MLNFRRFLTGGMIVATLVFTSLPVLADLILVIPTLEVLAQQPPRRHGISGISMETAIDTFMDTFNKRRSRIPGISRGSGICPIAPG